MGNLDFLNNKPSNIVISTTVEELSALSNKTANCLPSLSITTIYSKLGLTTTNVGDKLDIATNCAIRISSDVNFTPNANGKDVISIFYDPNIIPDTDEAKSKGFNAICAPGDWNTKADIKLNKDLADIMKAGHIGCLNVYIHNDMPFVVEDIPVVYRPFISISYENINSIGGLCIREINRCISHGDITVIYFNPSIPLEEYDKWIDKYFLLEP